MARDKESTTRNETTKEQRADVIILRARGKTFGEIEAETGILRQTAQKITKRFEQRKTLDNKPGRGRKEKLDQRAIRRIDRFVALNPRATIDDIIAESTIKGASSTVKKALKTLHYRTSVPRKKFWLDEKMMKSRRAWCKDKQFWGKEKWRKIVWCDEVAIKIGNIGGGRDWVRRKPNTAYQHRYLRPTFIFGGTTVHFWACYTYGKRGPITPVRRRGPKERISKKDKGGMNRWQYIKEVLQPHFVPFWNGIGGSKEGYIFMQDKSGPHRAKLVQKFLRDNGIDVFNWVSNSPDLNPIENIWRALRKRLKV